jgi:Ankyrin repeats (3 copies)
MSRDRLPRWLRLWGLLNAPPALYLLLVYFWMKFPLTRAASPLPGFGSFEGGPLTMLLLMPFLVLYLIWLLVVVVKTGVSLSEKSTVSPGRWVVILGSLLLVALAWTDESTWDRFSVAKLARTPEGGERVIHAAVEGNVGTVRAFLAHGIAINNCYLGWTALHAAASVGQTRMVRHLLDLGANVNAVDTGSSTPVDVAEGQHYFDIVTLLRARGGKEYNELASADQQTPCPVSR